MRRKEARRRGARRHGGDAAPGGFSMTVVLVLPN